MCPEEHTALQKILSFESIAAKYKRKIKISKKIGILIEI
jgi:hypothetical protein